MEKEKISVCITAKEKAVLDLYKQLSQADKETVDILMNRLMKHNQEAKDKC